MNGGMSPEEFQNYLGLLSRLLRLKTTEREAIAEELRSHLEERLAALTAEGIEPTRAISMALAEFGDAAALAAEFTAVSRIYKRRWIMRLTVGSIAASVIMAAVLISYWPGGPAHLNQSTAQAEQAQQKTVSKPEAKIDANTETQAKLEQLSDADFVETPLSQVLEYMADVTKVQFHLDNRTLTDAGVTSDTPITFHLKNVPFEMMLRLMFRDLNLGYWLDNGVVIVSTAEEVEAHLETRIYRIDDLIIAPSADRVSESTPDTSVRKHYKVKYDSLIELIATTVRPTSWACVGGVGSIAPYRGTLVISQTADVHREILKFLNDLRQSINPDIVDEDSPQIRKPATMGAMGGGMSGMGMFGSSDKKSDDKDTTKPSSDPQNKAPGR